MGSNPIRIAWVPPLGGLDPECCGGYINWKIICFGCRRLRVQIPFPRLKSPDWIGSNRGLPIGEKMLQLLPLSIYFLPTIGMILLIKTPRDEGEKLKRIALE